jgi:hypothetical protein
VYFDAGVVPTISLNKIAQPVSVRIGKKRFE